MQTSIFNVRSKASSEKYNWGKVSWNPEELRCMLFEIVHALCFFSSAVFLIVFVSLNRVHLLLAYDYFVHPLPFA